MKLKIIRLRDCSTLHLGCCFVNELGGLRFTNRDFRPDLVNGAHAWPTGSKQNYWNKPNLLNITKFVNFNTKCSVILPCLHCCTVFGPKNCLASRSLRCYLPFSWVCNRIDLSEKINYFRTSFFLRSALTFCINFVTFVRFRLFYRSRSCHTFESLHFWVDPTIRDFSTEVCLRVHCRIGATSAPRYVSYVARLWLLTRPFSVLSTEGTLSIADSKSEGRHVRGSHSAHLLKVQ